MCTIAFCQLQLLHIKEGLSSTEVTIGPARVETGFQTAESFVPPTLEVDGEVAYGDAVELAVRMVEERKATYRTAGVHSYRPWIVLMTKGDPAEDWERAAEAIRHGEEQKSFAFFSAALFSLSATRGKSHSRNLQALGDTPNRVVLQRLFVLAQSDAS